MPFWKRFLCFLIGLVVLVVYCIWKDKKIEEEPVQEVFNTDINLSQLEVQKNAEQKVSDKSSY